MPKEIFNKEYSDESMIDLCDDLDWELGKFAEEIGQDEHGFTPGTYKVSIIWTEDE